nr:immunoglobulin heavy chain junction region [Macaca mulatta]
CARRSSLDWLNYYGLDSW